MALSDGTYYIDSRESTDICAVGSNETYETIRTLPDSHSPQPWQVRRNESGTYSLTYGGNIASSISDVAVALVPDHDQPTEWVLTPVGPKNLYIIQDYDIKKAWFALDRGYKNIISLTHVDMRRPPMRALFEFSRVEV